MNAQQIYDTVLTGLRKQGVASMGRSTHGGARCVYRADDGCKCAIGMLIPDADYHKDMEGNDLFGLMCAFSLPAYLIENDDLLDALQLAHDDHMPRRGQVTDRIKDWEASMSTVAKRFRLTYTPPQGEPDETV